MPDPKRPRLFLIDAMGYIFRAYHAPMERLRSPSGVPTKVPYLFATMVRRLLKAWQPDYLAVVFDVAAPTFRDELFAAYKAQRPPMPEDLAQQLPYVRRLCEAMRLPVLEYEGYEADDVIATLARQAAARGLEVFVVTSDKDLLQLVDDHIRVLLPTRNDRVVDRAGVEELLGVPPEQVPDVMALMGDAIDNVPGARGIGEKGARELIRRFGSVEAALEHAAEVENKRYRQALLEQREQILLSKQLATLRTDVPVELSLEQLRRAEPDLEALRALYAELGFSSLLRELGPTPPSEPLACRRLDTPEALAAFIESLPADRPTALWVQPEETEQEPGFGTRAVAVELAVAPGTAVAAWLDEAGGMLRALRPWLADPGRPKVVHDARLAALLLTEDAIAGVRDALNLYSYLLRPTTARHGLDDIALRYLNLTPAGRPGEHADLLLRLAPHLRAEIDAQGLRDLYERIELPLAPVLARMERHGVRVDPQALAAFSAAAEEELKRLELQIYELAGVRFNINSPRQLAEVLYQRLQLSPPRRSGRGRTPSTAAAVLEELAPHHPLPRLIRDYREAAKLKSTYADVLPKMIHPATGRIHPRFNQTGTATGRLSCSSPNLQNIPVRTELGRQIRACFVADPGHLLVSADYSQIELRILAHLSGDPVLMEAFRKNEDIHARTAAEVFGVPPSAQTAEHRRIAKIINFGILYGLSAYGLAQQLGIEPGEAAGFIERYFERYRGVREYLDRHLAEVRRTGVTRTLFGRLRPLPEIQSPVPAQRSLAERAALNAPIQGTAADLMKLAMIEVDRHLQTNRVPARMILQVHDELLFEVPEESVTELTEPLRAMLEHIYPLAVPLRVEIKQGPNWRDLA